MNDRPIDEIAEIIFNMNEKRVEFSKSSEINTLSKAVRNNEARRKIEERREMQIYEDGGYLGMNFSDASSFRQLTPKQRVAIDKIKENYDFGASKSNGVRG